MNDPHLQWIAECFAELEGFEQDAIDEHRHEAQVALARVRAAGDPRGVGGRYEELLQALALRERDLKLDEILADLTPEQFQVLLQDPRRQVRLRVLQRAEELGLEGGFEVLEVHLIGELDPYVVASGIKALGVLGGSRAVSVFGNYRRHVDPRVRANAVEGLCNAGATEADLLPWVEDMDHRVRANAAFGLMDLSPRRAREVLRRLLEENDVQAQKAVMEILERIAPGTFLEFYLDALEFGQPEMIGGILAVLTRTPDPRVTRLLLEMLEDEERSFAFRSQVMQAAKALSARLDEDQDTSRELLDAAVKRYFDQITRDERPRPAPVVRPPPPEADPEQPEEDRPMTGAERMREEVKKHVRVNGRVMDSSNRKPVPRATVRVASTGRQELTDRRGRFSVDRLVRGETYVFVVERQGYPTRSVRYRCSGQQEQNLQILLIGGSRAR